MSSSNCCFLTCIQISQEAGQVVWNYHLFQNFPQFIVIHTVKGFGIVNKAEIDVFLELSCFFHNLADVGNLISGSSAFSKTSLNIRKFTVHVLLKPGLENFEHYFTSMFDECKSKLKPCYNRNVISPTHSHFLFGIIQLLSHVWLFATPWTIACCPSLFTGVCSNSCSLSQWCYQSISPSASPFYCFKSFPASGSFLNEFALYIR